MASQRPADLCPAGKGDLQCIADNCGDFVRGQARAARIGRRRCGAGHGGEARVPRPVIENEHLVADEIEGAGVISRDAGGNGAKSLPRQRRCRCGVVAGNAGEVPQCAVDSGKTCRTRVGL